MIDLQQYKVRRLARFNQLVLLDRLGKVIQSCNSIFDTTPYLKKSIRQDIPFLDSIFDIINGIPPNSSGILFSKVQSFFNQLEGVYDFTFSKILIEDESYILWSIYDFTALYKDLIDYQQRYNNLEIRKQLSYSILESIGKFRKENDDIKAMVLTLSQRNDIQEFELYSCIQSVLNVFTYLDNITINYEDSGLKKVMRGDVTWFKFILYHLLDNVISTYKVIDIELNPMLNDSLDSTYLNLNFSFFGEIKNPKFFRSILKNPNIDTYNLNNEEQVFLSKLYSIQKIAHQYNGYLEFKPLDNSYQKMTTTLTFSFNFKRV
jgi:hypothetical protein